MTKNEKMQLNNNKKQTRIHISPIDVRDFASIFEQNQELRIAKADECLVFAYNIIFNPIVQNANEINLSNEQLEKVNLLLLAAENLINKKLDNAVQIISPYTRTINKSRTSFIPDLDKFIQAAENNYLNTLINETNETTYISITQQKGTDRSNRTKRIEENFGTKTYRMKAALVFYLIPNLAKALNKKDIKNYGYLIHHINEICFDIALEMPKRNGGNSRNNREQALQDLYSQFYDEYKDYKKEILGCFDWKKYADSEYIKQKFIECAESDISELPQNVIDDYETDCLRRKNLTNN